MTRIISRPTKFFFYKLTYSYFITIISSGRIIILRLLLKLLLNNLVQVLPTNIFCHIKLLYITNTN